MQFRTQAEGFITIRNRIITVMSVVVIIVMTIFCGPGLFSDDPITRESMLIVIPILLVIFLVTTSFSIKTQKNQFLSFVLTIEKDVITRERLPFPTMTIDAKDILKIERGKDGSLLITSSNGNQKIAVPSQVENYDQMIALLSQFKPITEIKKNYPVYTLLSTVATLGLLAVDFLIKDRIINLISYSLTIILMTVSLVIIQRSSLVDPKIKRMSWVMLVPLLSFISILVALIKGQ
jgi:cytochrome bd-type quinol oxidase subunit 2